jgi:hypothetical protein
MRSLWFLLGDPGRCSLTVCPSSVSPSAIGPTYGDTVWPPTADHPGVVLVVFMPANSCTYASLFLVTPATPWHFSLPSWLRKGTAKKTHR